MDFVCNADCAVGIRLCVHSPGGQPGPLRDRHRGRGIGLDFLRLGDLVGQVVAIGFDGNQDLQNFVKDGTLAGIVVQGSYQMGEKGVETVTKLINKEKVEKFVDTGVVVVTKDNIEKPEAKNVLY